MAMCTMLGHHVFRRQKIDILITMDVFEAHHEPLLLRVGSPVDLQVVEHLDGGEEDDERGRRRSDGDDAEQFARSL